MDNIFLKKAFKRLCRKKLIWHKTNEKRPKVHIQVAVISFVLGGPHEDVLLHGGIGRHRHDVQGRRCGRPGEGEEEGHDEPLPVEEHPQEQGWQALRQAGGVRHQVNGGQERLLAFP